MSARPLVTVQNIEEDGKEDSLNLPAVFSAPIRTDIVQFVHTNMNKNKRQPYAVSRQAGHQHSAESWGTGRAVSRIPRVSGGGTSRAGQAAFGNMCRKGRMFNPTRIWRKWHRKINTNQKRFAVASAIAASRITSLVMARGHKISNVPELPLVVSDSLESLQKTKAARAALEKLGAGEDIEKVIASRKLRRGKGKMRDRRFTQRRGPLVVYKNDSGLVKAFRNLRGVDLCQVSRLNLLQLAPGGHVGRFIIWTAGAFEEMNNIWGSVDRPSTQKKNYTLPRPLMANADLARLINSDEVQSKLKAPKKAQTRARRKKNPLKNFGERVRLNPYALALRRAEYLVQARQAEGKELKATVAKRKYEKESAKKHRKRQKLNFARISASGIVSEDDESAAEESGDEDAPAATKSEKKAAAGGARPKATRDIPVSKYMSHDNDDCVGKPAPSLTGLAALGDAKAIEEKKNTVVVFFAKYHKPGHKYMPLYSEFAKKFGDAQVVAVAIDPAVKDTEKFLDPAGKYQAAFPTTLPVYHDEGKKVKEAFELVLEDTLSVVHAFVIDATGTIVWHQDHSQVGATAPDFMDEMEKQVGQLLAGEPLFSYGDKVEESESESSSEEDDEDEDEDDDEEEM